MKAHTMLLTALTFISLEANQQIPIEYIYSYAQAGNPDAQYDLANLLRNGKVVEQDMRLSFHLYHKSANKNNVNASFEVANAFRYGLGVKVNHAWARHWYSKASKMGHKEAQLILAKDYNPQLEQLAINN
jgi:TPR repeat protein